jgi:hypothetical protein
MDARFIPVEQKLFSSLLGDNVFEKLGDDEYSTTRTLGTRARFSSG